MSLPRLNAPLHGVGIFHNKVLEPVAKLSVKMDDGVCKSRSVLNVMVVIVAVVDEFPFNPSYVGQAYLALLQQRFIHFPVVRKQVRNSDC